MANWQRFETEVAKRLNGIRHKRQDYGESDLDVETSDFIVECKFRKAFPDYLIAWLEQAKSYVKGSKRIPILAWKMKNTKTDDALVIIRLADFEKFLSRENTPSPLALPEELANNLKSLNKILNTIYID